MSKMPKTLQDIRNQMKRIVEDTNLQEVKKYTPEDIESLKDDIFEDFNVNDTVLLGGVPEAKVAKLGKLLFPSKLNGPFTFVFECIVWQGDTDYYKKYKKEEYTAQATDFVNACKEAFDWRERHLYDIYDVAGFIDVK